MTVELIIEETVDGTVVKPVVDKTAELIVEETVGGEVVKPVADKYSVVSSSAANYAPPGPPGPAGKSIGFVPRGRNEWYRPFGFVGMTSNHASLSSGRISMCFHHIAKDHYYDAAWINVVTPSDDIGTEVEIVAYDAEENFAGSFGRVVVDSPGGKITVANNPVLLRQGSYYVGAMLTSSGKSVTLSGFRAPSFTNVSSTDIQYTPGGGLNYNISGGVTPPQTISNFSRTPGSGGNNGCVIILRSGDAV